MLEKLYRDLKFSKKLKENKKKVQRRAEYKTQSIEEINFEISLHQTGTYG